MRPELERVLGTRPPEKAWLAEACLFTRRRSAKGSPQFLALVFWVGPYTVALPRSRMMTLMATTQGLLDLRAAPPNMLEKLIGCWA